MTSTPNFFVNGRMIVGAPPYEMFARIIDEELAGPTTKPPLNSVAKLTVP